MLSEVIHSQHSYSAVLLAEQPIHQRSVHPGPLVLGADLLKNQRLHRIITNLSHAFHITYYYVNRTIVYLHLQVLALSLYGSTYVVPSVLPYN